MTLTRTAAAAAAAGFITSLLRHERAHIKKKYIMASTAVASATPTAASSVSPEILAAFTDGTNERKIPKIRFIEDVPAFLKKSKTSIEYAFQYLNELLQKYRFMEKHMQKNKARLREKLPEISQTLNMIIFLQKKQDGEDDDAEDNTFVTHFPLADSVYGKASVKPTGTVNLWLGADIMLEYTYKEAHALLEKNLSNAQERLKEVESDLLFLRDQITTAEVNIARMFNHDVLLRKKSAASGGGEKGKGKKK